MSSRKSSASLLVTCLLAVGFLTMAPAANAASAGQSVVKSGESARNRGNVRNSTTEIKHRRRGKRSKRGRPLPLPIVPYGAYDYPYYYKRGYFPTHIGPGYMYYGYPYFYRMRYSDRCSYRNRRCVAGKKGACICR